ncbi:MAG: TonB-dependent receptor [Methylobacter sp.]|nr:TonB-dependent receptor [Methylobacter sp.]
MKKYILLLGVGYLGSSIAAETAKNNTTDTYQGEDMVITSGHKLFPNTTVATPSFKVTEKEINKTNLTDASDAIKMAPSVQVRRRFYSDTNGVTAIRGSTNFQTNHFNLFVDGIPLHNPVQTKWNGAPKWSLIAPNAIDTATVFYGPYSAEHKGSFGGTFDLKTKLPEKFEMHMDATGIIQDSHRFGQDEVLTGHKEFISAGNRYDKFRIYGFFNHLENEGQAQSFSNTNSPLAAGASRRALTSATGAALTNTIMGAPSVISGDLGLNINVTDLYEFKVGYDFNDDLRAMFTIAYEDSTRSSQSRSYMKDANGNTLWGGKASQYGYEFDVNPVSFGRPTLGGSENERQTLAYALNLSGKVTDNWSIDTTASLFDAFKDVTVNNNVSTNNPAYSTDKSGRIIDTDVWWADYSLKLATQNFLGRDDLGFMSGYQFNNSFLDLNTHNSNNVDAESRDTFVAANSNGGSTQTHSAFMQSDWDITDQWNVMAGFRYDHWSALRGRVANVGLPNRDASRVSPKTSIAFTPTEELSLRYSFSKAYRFPVAEELFESSTNRNSVNISDPNLQPEMGYFHDFKIQHELTEGYASVTFFYNQISNEILRTQTLLNTGVISNRTRSIDETETVGMEIAYVQDNIFDLPVGLSLNGTWLNKEIKKDSNNPIMVGKEWPRIPQWRAHGTATYHVTKNWDAIAALDYRGKQFANDDNSDFAGHVYGASDEYVLANFKTAYTMDVGHDIKAKFSVGVDNILDESYYDFHPYPQRTYFANISLDI